MSYKELCIWDIIVFTKDPYISTINDVIRTCYNDNIEHYICKICGDTIGKSIGDSVPNRDFVHLRNHISLHKGIYDRIKYFVQYRK